MHDIHTGSFARVSRSNFSAASQDTENLDKIKWLQEFDKEPQTGITSPLRHVITFYIQSTSGSFPTKFRWPLHHLDFLGIHQKSTKSQRCSGAPNHPQNTTDFSCSSLNWYLDILACSIQLDPCKKTNTKVPNKAKLLFQMHDPNDWTVTKKLGPTLFYP